jgi:hypothetical protein
VRLSRLPDSRAAAVDAYLIAWKRNRALACRLSAILPDADRVVEKDMRGHGDDLAWGSLVADVVEADRGAHNGHGAQPEIAHRTHVQALALAVVTGATKLITGWRAVALADAGGLQRVRAGAALIARGELSIVLAGLAAQAAIEARLTPLATAYLLIMAVAGPLLMHLAPRPAAVLAQPT